jgi:hypothetical protein
MADRPKPIQLGIRVRFPRGHQCHRIEVTPNGDIVATDQHGNEITPVSMERITSFSRSKAPKIQARSKMIGGRVSVGGVRELTQYDHVFAIDTNTRSVKGTQVSVACFLRCKFVPQGHRIHIDTETKIHFYEFHNSPGANSAEMLAILKLARDVVRFPDYSRKSKIAIISDCDINRHDAISARRSPIYGFFFLPRGFQLHYASSDTGRESPNRLINFCDKQSTIHLEAIESGTTENLNIRPLEEDPTVLYQYGYKDGVEFINTIIDETSLDPGSMVALYGLKDGPIE